MTKAAGMWIKFCNQISVYMKGPCTALIPDLMEKKNLTGSGCKNFRFLKVSQKTLFM